MIARAHLVGVEPCERALALHTAFPVLIDTNRRALGLDLGHGYRAYVLGTGPITVTADYVDYVEDDNVSKPRQVEMRRLELDAQADGIRRIYEARRQRQLRRQRMRVWLEWGVVLLFILVGLVWLGMQAVPTPKAPVNIEALP